MTVRSGISPACPRWCGRDLCALSASGKMTAENGGFTRFKHQKGGRHRFLILDDLRTARVHETMMQLCSQPPVK